MSKKSFIIIFLLFFTFAYQANAIALNLDERIDQYPQWQSKISLPTPEQDLNFPQWFKGKWQVTSILKEQIAPLAPQFQTPGFEQNQEYIDREINFNVQYVPTIELPKQDKFVPAVVPKKEMIIADRAFNGLAIAQAYMGKENVQKVTTNPSNSTEQITQFRTDNQLISTVIGRQQQALGENTFLTSELTRQFFRRPQSVYLNFVETTTKYQLINPNLIEGEQISAIYLSPEDPDYFIAINKPVALYYYTLKLEKIR